MNKIILTGSSGILGSSILKNLSKNFIFLNLINKSQINREYNKVKFSKINQKIIDNLVKVFKPDIIIHCAAMTNIEFCENNKKKCKISNYDLTKHLVNSCKKYDVKLIFISTDQVYNKNNYQSEKSILKAKNYYTTTKILSEKYIEKKLKNFLILRTNFFGHSEIVKKSFSDHIILNLRKKKIIYLFEDVLFNPINIQNLCKVIHDLILSESKGLFNIGTYPGLSKYEFGIKIAKKKKLNADLIVKDRFSKRKNLTSRPLDMRMNILKIKKIIKNNKIFNINKNISLL